MSKATPVQMRKDHVISRRLTASEKPKRFSGLKVKWAITKKLSQEYSATLLAVLYIVNGALASAILFDIVHAPQKVRYISASLAIAYSAVGFIMFINRGVRHQLNERNLTKGD